MLRQAFPWCAGVGRRSCSACSPATSTAKQRQQVLDYDDLLLYWARMMAEPAIAAGHRRPLRPRAGRRVPGHQRAAGRDPARRSSRTARGVTVVGDDAQAIYGFRAATVRNILDFPARFTPPAAVVTLEQNYRSTQPILAAANARHRRGASERLHARSLCLDARVSAQQPRLVDGRRRRPAQADYVVRARARQPRGRRRARASRRCCSAPPTTAARSRSSSRRRNIPFVKYGGLKFLEAAHVKDVLALLRWAENPRDRVAAFRVLQLLPGIGPGTAAQGARPCSRPAASASRRSAGFAPPRAAAASLAGAASALLPSACSAGQLGRTAGAGAPLL